MPFGYGPPAVVKPSWELLGDALLELSRHEEARKAYQRSLERNPGRRLSLLGLARAAGAE
jgi:cytochrome c-type biogenesis protein CcmH/NrfG